MSNFGGGDDIEAGRVRTRQLILNNKTILANTESPVVQLGDVAKISGLESDIDSLQLNKSDNGHNHVSADITDLQTKLDEKANTSHNHVSADITDLQTKLDEKANSAHTHLSADITDLQTKLDEKANTLHNHVSADITDLQSKLDEKANTSHTHEISNVNGLQDALNGKSNNGHTHVISDVVNLQDTLNNKLNTNDGSVNKMWEIVDGTGGFEKRVQLLRSVVGGDADADYEISIAGVDATKVYARDFITKDDNPFAFLDGVGKFLGTISKGIGTATNLKYLKIAGGTVGGLLLTNLAVDTLNEMGDLFSTKPEEAYDNNQISVNTLTGDLYFSTFRKFDIDPTKGLDDNEWGDAIDNIIGWQAYVPKEWKKVALEDAHIDMYSIKLRNYSSGFNEYGNRKQTLSNENDTLYYTTENRLYCQGGRLHFNGSGYAKQSEIPNLSGYALIEDIPTAFNGGTITSQLKIQYGDPTDAPFLHILETDQASGTKIKIENSYYSQTLDLGTNAGGYSFLNSSHPFYIQYGGTNRLGIGNNTNVYGDLQINDGGILRIGGVDVLSNIYTKTEVDNLGYITSENLSSGLDTAIKGSSIETSTFIDFPENGYTMGMTTGNPKRLWVNDSLKLVFRGDELAIKNNHYTKVEVDGLISGASGSVDLSSYYTKTEVDSKFYLSGTGMTALKVNFDTTSGPYNNDAYFASNIAHKWYLDFPYTNTLVQDSHHLAMKLHRNISYFGNIPQFNTILEFGESGQTRHTEFEYNSLRFHGTEAEIFTNWNSDGTKNINYHANGAHHFNNDIWLPDGKKLIFNTNFNGGLPYGPDRAPLQVNTDGIGISYIHDHIVYTNQNNAYNNYFDTNDDLRASILCKNDILTFGALRAVSDERIKTNIQPSNNCLEKVRQIEHKTYEYIDKYNKGYRNVYGFIAQQVKPILPEAVKIKTDFIPNIFEIGEVKGNTLTIRKNTNVSEKAKIKLINGDKQEFVAKIKNVVDNKTLVFIENIPEGQYFVYGEEINDFHTLDKNTLFTVLFGAVQELDKEVQALRIANGTAAYVSTVENGKIVEIHNNELITVNTNNYKGFYGVCNGNKQVYTKQCEILVINKAGNMLGKGDLITSYLGGYGMKQGDDLIKAYTVAKCCEEVNFANVADTVELDGVIYKYKLVKGLLT